MNESRIFLSAPHIGAAEQKYVAEAFATNWVAPLGPNVDAFEKQFCETVSSSHAAALSSGTAALHLAIRALGFTDGTAIACSTLTFAASANPILYERCHPVFIDSEYTSWNIDPNLFADAVKRQAKARKPIRALVLVHLYGQSADIAPILEICRANDICLIEDAAEALGATYTGSDGKSEPRAPGTFGRVGIFSFNGNKIVTTAGGGMLVSEDETLVKKVRYLSTQARDPAPHYEHSVVGFNYRLSNVLAGIGRGQLMVLPDRVEARRRVFDHYRKELSDISGLSFMPEAPWGRSTRWLTCIRLDESKGVPHRETLRKFLEARNIESRPVWKPMHLQPVFAGCTVVNRGVADALFADGLCLPSSSSLSDDELSRVVTAVRECVGQRRPGT